MFRVVVMRVARHPLEGDVILGIDGLHCFQVATNVGMMLLGEALVLGLEGFQAVAMGEVFLGCIMGCTSSMLYRRHVCRGL